MEVSDDLLALKDQDLFLYCLPEVPDFTQKDTTVSLVFCTNTFETTVKLPADLRQISALFKLLFPPTTILIGWGIKPVFTYFYAKTGKNLNIQSNLFDLKIIEKFSGINQSKPESFQEAKKRLVNSFKHKEIYKSVQLPLICEVLPKIEGQPLIDRLTKQRVYSYYEIEGQLNGRLRTHRAYSKSYLPHSLSIEERSNLYPPSADDVFTYYDFRHMEVSVLQWLSKDKVLGEILDSGLDVYEVIWKKITGIDCNENYRKVCKSIFLPVVFGKGASAIASDLSISESTARTMVSKIYTIFNDAFEWINTQTVTDGYAIDFFGRKRYFDEEYKVRNFSIQAPAATICLHKLTQLSKTDNVACFIHDGYIVINTTSKAVSALESDDELYKGLKLKVSQKSSKNLNFQEINVDTN